MSTITIHGLDDALDKRIREKAKSQGSSLNKTIKELLEKSLAINQKKKKSHREEYMEFFGVWTEDDLKEFDCAVNEFDAHGIETGSVIVTYDSHFKKVPGVRLWDNVDR